MTHHKVISTLSNGGKVRSVTAVITLLAMLIATVPASFARGSVRSVNHSGDGGSWSGRRTSGSTSRTQSGNTSSRSTTVQGRQGQTLPAVGM
jgi:hypothetical protein